MESSRIKAKETRLNRLAEEFKSIYKRQPTEEELDNLYRAEMRKIADMSRRNQGGLGGFAKLKADDPDLLKQRQRKGGLHRWPKP